MNRRRFLVATAALAATPGWASAASPDYLTAALRTDGSYVLCGMSEGGEILFEIDLPDRGHAAAARPTHPEAVAFARRPGSFAMIVDCAEGRETLRLHAPKDRHFYGHGVFSQDGRFLYTTENAFETGEGRVGVWDAADRYKRIGEFASGGIGPHDVKLTPDGETLVAANGGIRTHPDYGREKLNLPDMRSNVTYLTADGITLDQVEPPEEFRQNSMRHLAIRSDGLVAVAMQWQGPTRQVVPLLALQKPNGKLKFLPESKQSRMKGYAGSVAFSGDEMQVAISAPRGGTIKSFHAADGALCKSFETKDACGLATAMQGFIATSGRGLVMALGENLTNKSTSHLSYDNHLVKR